jgi:hypothetical protein
VDASSFKMKVSITAYHFDAESTFGWTPTSARHKAGSLQRRKRGAPAGKPQDICGRFRGQQGELLGADVLDVSIL